MDDSFVVAEKKRGLARFLPAYLGRRNRNPRVDRLDRVSQSNSRHGRPLGFLFFFSFHVDTFFHRSFAILGALSRAAEREEAERTKTNSWSSNPG